MAKYDSLSELTREDRLDSRDLEDVISELEDEQAEATEDKDDDAWDDTDGAALLDALREFREETEGYSGDTWSDGVFFIADDDFEDYAQETAEDTGMLEDANTWPLRCIDWAQAARELQMDYTSATIGGREYWFR
jgi:hypothetical protein